jgi:hypothetical protein
MITLTILSLSEARPIDNRFDTHKSSFTYWIAVFVKEDAGRPMDADGYCQGTRHHVHAGSDFEAE